MGILKRFDDWLDASNRLIHMYGGLAIMIAMMFTGLLMGISLVPLAVEITIAIFAAMVYVDMKDKQQGNKFDWSDVFAGMIPCIAMWVGILITKLFV